jgi:predicted Holliday junction resolvase-like endonuclease
MSLTVTLFLVIAILFLIIFGCANAGMNDKRKIKELETQLAEQKKNVNYLMNHLEEILKIKADEKTVSEKIEGAKTDEEIADIVSAIVSANNNRVQNYKAGK